MTINKNDPEMYTNNHGHRVQKNSELTIYEDAYFYVCKDTLTLIIYQKLDDPKPKVFARFGDFGELESKINRVKYKLKFED